MIGETVGNYTITGLLSKGGMGAVYTAEHTLIGRKAAVKVLLPEVSQRPEVVKRFFNEARATAAIGHPGIVEIFDFGRLENGNAYLVMELLEGTPLTKRLSEPMDASRALALMEHIASALEAAHAKGIVHRDLKPGNIVLVPDPGVRFGERTKLLDFGIAKLADSELGKEYATRTGTIMGTPAYMAPEQCRGASDVDLRADLYALGCILFHMVCARPPFLGFGAGEIIGMQQFVPPPKPRSFNPKIPPEVEALILRLLEKELDARVQSAAALMAELAALASSVGDESSGWQLLERHGSNLEASNPSSIESGQAGDDARPAPADQSDAVETAAPHTPVAMPGEATAAMGARSAKESPGETRANTDSLTTLNAAAHATAEPDVPAPVRRLGWWKYVAGLFVLGAGIAAWLEVGRDAPQERQASAADPVGPEAEAERDQAGATPAQAPGAAQTPPETAGVSGGAEALASDGQDGADTPGAGSAAEEPATVAISITSRPPNAIVYYHGRALGRTPLERYSMPRGADEIVLRVRKQGYRDREIRLVPSADVTRDVSLSRLRRRRRRAAEPGKRGSQQRPPGAGRPADPNSTINPFEQ